MNEYLRGYATAVIEDAKSSNNLELLEQELSAFVRLLNAHSDLKLFLTDSSIKPVAKENVVRELFDSRLNALSVDLIAYLVKVERSTVLTASLDELIERIKSPIIKSDNFFSEPRTFGIEAKARIKGYATRLFSNKNADEIAIVETQLFEVANLIDQSNDLKRFLSSVNVEVAQKCHVMADLLHQKLLNETLRIVIYAFRASKLRDPAYRIREAGEIVAELRGQRVALVRTYSGLSEAQLTALQRVLQNRVRHPLEIEVVTDKTLLGGIVIELGDLLIDGSLKQRLSALREEIA